MTTELKKKKHNSETRTHPRFWLIKFAPFRTAWSEIVRRGTFTLRGVRSPEARNNLKAMKKGDLVLFYQSQRDQAVIGVLEVARTAYPDPTSTDPQWVTCDFRPVRTLSRPVPLAEIKADPVLSDIPLVRRPRLSVMRLSAKEFQEIIHCSEESL